MSGWAQDLLSKLSKESYPRFIAIQKSPQLLNSNEELRAALLDFIADFANWENSTVREFLETSRALTQIAHEALGGAPGTRPLVVDPFAGGGSIPIEALRVGADSFASDLNPIPVLLNKVMLEYVPRYGQQLSDEVRRWGEWLKEEARGQLAELYPEDQDGAVPIAYLWARTIRCEGPACGAVIPLMNQRTISKRRSVGVSFKCSGRNIETDVSTGISLKDFGTGTVQNGKVTCPACGFTMPAERYRQRAKNHELGELHYCTILSLPDGSRKYRNPSAGDRRAFALSQTRLRDLAEEDGSEFNEDIPRERLSATEPRRLNILHYGYDEWGQIFNDRQKLCWLIFSRLLKRAFEEIARERGDQGLSTAVSTILGLTLSNILQYNCSMSTWLSDGMISVFIQSSSIPMRADYAEANPLMERLVGGLQYQLDRTRDVLSQFGTSFPFTGTVALGSATRPLLPEHSVDAFVTDPPYYFAIPYAELSDFFYVWLKRFLLPIHPDLFTSDTTPKADEAIQNLPHSQAIGQKNREHFETKIYQSLLVGHDEVRPSGIAIIVFAHASTEGWESLLNALLRAGWVITGSWPIDTEREGRMLASRQRALASSVHLVCRPRDRESSPVGDWRDVLRELPARIHDWMPRLAQEGVVGADAIFACLGPALEIFSRYSRVEKANGETVELREYLEQVWAAVAKEALTMIFTGADTAGFEEDARLTAMWLWTLNAGRVPASDDDTDDAALSESMESDDGHEANKKKANSTGFVLEYDAARKIAQGLGAHLEDLGSLVEVNAERARLLPIEERALYLFGKEDSTGSPKPKKSAPQLDLFRLLGQEADDEEVALVDRVARRRGGTVLDRVHQSMILFAAGRGDALKRFLVEEGVGQDGRFWSLGQALSALYPAATNEKRWIDGVLARKKGLGF